MKLTLYQVMLTKEFCKILSSRGIVSFLRGKNYLVLNEKEAFTLFKSESQIEDLSESAVTITEI
jgi:hypothetical protein